MTLSERQFNYPSCIQSEKRSCQIFSWVTSPCDGMKCFHCSPKYLCFDTSRCHFLNIDEETKQNRTDNRSSV